MESTSSDKAKTFETARLNRGDSVSQLASKAADAASSMVDSAEKSIGQASSAAQEAARNVWSQAGDVASDLAETSRSAANSVARQINDQPLVAMLLGAAAVGYLASLLIHGRR
jgi:ElaB/YqjD/DUF883 family membrane-anchored ribosome-binding protein